MDDILFEVRITALLDSRFPPARIHAAFAELFCVSMAEAQLRLASLPLRVRGDLSQEQAGKYQRVLSRAGMACEVLPQAQAGSDPASVPAPEPRQACTQLPAMSTVPAPTDPAVLGEQA